MADYFIVPTVEVTTKMINLCTSNSKEDLRKNADGTLSILKVIPPPHNIFLDYMLYTKEEILDELKKEEWVLPT